MILDADSREDDWFRDRMFDVCVVGSGAGRHHPGACIGRTRPDGRLFEGGGGDFSTESQELYGGDIVGEGYRPLDETRLRFFGGTSNHWSGLCCALDECDFAPASGQSQGADAYAIGKEYGLVGRNFCKHLHFNVGVMLLKETAIGLNAVGPRPEFIDRAHILNFGLRLNRSATGKES